MFGFKSIYRVKSALSILGSDAFVGERDAPLPNKVNRKNSKARTTLLHEKHGSSLNG